MAVWTVRTYHKKNVSEIEHWTQRDGAGRLTVNNGFRWGTWTVTTSDDRPPEFEFTEVPGGDGARDSINMLDACVNNIEEVDLVDMSDGGCWYDIDIEGVTEEEEEELREWLDENSVYELEDREDSWYNDETEWWIWGPIEIQNESGETVRIISADADGNVVDYKDE